MHTLRIVGRSIACLFLCFLLTATVLISLEFMRARRDLHLVETAAMGDANQVRDLLEQGADPNATHIEGSSALWWAVMSHSLPTVEVLLNHGASPNTSGQYNSVLDQALAEYDSETPPGKQPTEAGILRTLVVHGVNTSGIKPDSLEAQKLHLIMMTR